MVRNILFFVLRITFPTNNQIIQIWLGEKKTQVLKSKPLQAIHGLDDEGAKDNNNNV